MSIRFGQIVIGDWVTAPYSTLHRLTLSYTGLLLYLAATTLCGNGSAFWPWVVLTIVSALVLVLVLVIAGDVLARRDERITPRRAP